MCSNKNHFYPALSLLLLWKINSNSMMTEVDEDEEKTPYFKRYRQIIKVLIKYGFEDIVAHTRFKGLNWRKILPDREGIPAMEYSRHERI